MKATTVTTKKKPRFIEHLLEIATEFW